MLKVGDCIRVQTRTREDVLGVCYYEIIATGLKSPEPGREKAMDGIKARMLGGSGPAAREGMEIIDSQFKIGSEIASGITEVMDKAQADKLLSDTPKPGPNGGHGVRPGTGVVEMD